MANDNLDRSYLDAKYFIDPYVYNCPFCNRRHVRYSTYNRDNFNWSANKTCFVYYIQCEDCENISMHLSFEDITEGGSSRFKRGIDIDSKIFYSQPTSFFAIDPRVPAIIRELITEAEGCLKMNHLTGASACMRKAIYELTVKEGASEQDDYEHKIKSLKSKYPTIDSDLFDILAHIQSMTSDKIHEQSWDKWDTYNLKVIIETLKSILYEIYVLPDEKKGRSSRVKQLMERIKGDKKQSVEPEASEARDE